MTRTRIWILAAALVAIIGSAAGLALAQHGVGQAEVRIAAQRLEDGRTEFALQQRHNGEWGERISPSARFLPANPTPGWKSSTPVTLDANRGDLYVGGERIALVSQGDDLAHHDRSGSGWRDYDNGRFDTAVHDREASLASYVSVYANNLYTNSERPSFVPSRWLTVSCGHSHASRLKFDYITDPDRDNPDHWPDFAIDHSGTILVTFGLPGVEAIRVEQPLPFYPFGQYNVEYSFTPPAADELAATDELDGGYDYEEVWDVHFVQYASDSPSDTRARECEDLCGHSVTVPPTGDFYDRLRQSETLDIRFTGADDESVELTFDLGGVFDTPEQPNIDRCGDYEATLANQIELRIAAQALDDGRIEFALQQRVNGEWQDRISPRGRYFPADPPPGWKISTPVQLSSKSQDGITREAQEAEYDSGRIVTYINYYAPGTETLLRVWPNDVELDEYRPIHLTLICEYDKYFTILLRGVWFRTTTGSDGQLSYHRIVSAQFYSDDNNLLSTYDGEWDWHSAGTQLKPDGGSPTEVLEGEFFQLLRQSSSVTVSGTADDPFGTFGGAEGESVEVELTFDLEGVFDTPVQPNLDYCGQY